MEKGIVQDLVNQSGSIVPIVEGKRSIKNWNQYQTQAATKEEVTEWVRSGNYSGFGLMMGHGDFHVNDDKRCEQKYGRKKVICENK